MQFNITWNEDNYKDLLKYLENNKDDKYKEFHKKIVNYDNVIGVKSDELKKIAKEISKNDYKSFFKVNNSNLHELIMIEVFIIGYLKTEFEDVINYSNNYLKKVKTWAHIDSYVSNLKIIKKYPKDGFTYAKKLIHSKNNYTKRCGIIMLLNYYLHDKYIDKVLEIVSKIKTNDYYVKMAISWLMSVAYIKKKKKTLVYIVNIKDDFAYNKTLSKIIESNRISKEEKEFIKSLKKKNG